MKIRVLREVKKGKKFLKIKQGKVFTKKKLNSTIKSDYIPFGVNDNIYKRRDGLYMKQTKQGELEKKIEKLSKKYNKSEDFIKLLIKICLNFKIDNYEVPIENYLMKK